MIKYRLATPADAGGIARVMTITQRQAYAGIYPAHLLENQASDRMSGHYAARVEQILQEGGCFFVAETFEDKVVGFASGGLNRDGPSGYEAELYNIFVLPDFQGQRIGVGLFLQVIRFLQAEPFTSLSLWTIRGTQAGGWYTHLQGQFVATRSETVAGTEITLDCYGWPSLEQLVALLAAK
jgi:GNAT superfamily N-acetyltransferase